MGKNSESLENWGTDVGFDDVESDNPQPQAGYVSNAQEVEMLISECLKATERGHKEKIDSDEAEKVAYKFLAAMLKLSNFIAEYELTASQAKSEIERVRGEKYFLFKSQAADKKMTDAALENALNKDEDVLAAKHAYNTAKANNEKWKFVARSIELGHVYFKGIAKSKGTNWE